MFQKECVLITGANGGMGQAAATAFYREGASLVLCDLDTEGLSVFAKQQSFDANRCICLSCDVTKEAAVKQTVKTAVQTFGGVDHLVNCAGIDGRMAYIADMEEEDFDIMMNVNVKGTFFFMKYAIKDMLKRKQGTIVNIASIAGISASRRKPFYCASKHAVNGLSKSAALEYVEQGIRINAVCPGSVDTAMIRSMEERAFPGEPEKARADFTKGIPMKRYAKPQEIADLIVFLSSEKASYITGNCYTIDGGIAAK